ncbi:hypothetical protein FRC01_011183, partial [Tulasnella sp. 417]
MDKAKEVEELPKDAEDIEDADTEEVADDVEETKGVDGDHLDRNKFVAMDLVNLKSHNLLDLLSMAQREAPAEEDDDDEARAILSRPENDGEDF